jgi:hypothetical protein
MSRQSKNYLVSPMINFAFLIHAAILASSFRSGVMMDPKYLKLREKPILSSWGSLMSSGRYPSSSSFFASASKGGDYIASDFDLVVKFLMCIIRPKHAKCFCSLLAVSSSSFRNILLSMYRAFLKSKVLSFAEVFWFRSLPLQVCRLPFLFLGKKENSIPRI